MQLLITRSEIPHFYRVDQGELNELVPLNFSEHEICQPTLKIKFPLPYEITTMILHHLFDMYLYSHNYDLAAALTWICKSFSTEIYNQTYGRSLIAFVTRVKRMCNTMYLLERIHDDYLTMIRTNRFSACRIIKRGFVESEATKFHPWDLVLDCFASSHYGVISSEEEPIDQFEVGPLNGDIVWTSGRYLKDGSYECTRFKHPVLNLEICNVADENPITSLYLRRNRPFRRFMALLKRCYGPNTAIHVLYNDGDGNPFDESQTGYLEF